MPETATGGATELECADARVLAKREAAPVACSLRPRGFPVALVRSGQLQERDRERAKQAVREL